MAQKSYVTGYYWDDKDLIEGIRTLQNNNIDIADVRTPFPVHGLDKVLKMRRSRLPRAGFVAGVMGAAIGFGFQAWVFTEAWPLNFGGKPFLSVPSFIPVTFELTVLMAAFALVFGFLISSKLGPGADTIIFDEEVTNDRFQIVLEVNEGNSDVLQAALSQAGAEGVKRHDI
ncbi:MULTISPECIES: DUF3341 domain-containing protein [unclassified Carboxylicivirga]|uniref:DUF3341 domain-containing protein n=1 Tax=Carboxylicivirga TaxID=1628153 RepID=UPI003D34E2FA